MPGESVILDKLKEQLANFSFSKKKASRPADDDAEKLADEIAEENAAEEAAEVARRAPTFQEKLATQLPFLAKFLKPAEEASSNDATQTGVKPGVAGGLTQRQKIIRGVLAVGILYAVADTFMAGDEEASGEAAGDATEATGPTAEQLAAKKAARKKKKAEEAAAAAAAAAQASGTTEPAPTEPIATAPVTSTDVAPDPATAPPSDVASTPPPEAAASPETVATTPEQIPESAPATVAPETAVTDPAPPATAVPPVDAVPVDGGMQPKGEGTGADQVTETPNAGDNVDKILEDLEKQMKDSPQTQAVAKEYVQPPGYEFQGRGLVYNCLGKHWACIDAGSYRLCQQNYGYLKDKSKAKECWPDSVYETERACAFIQKAKITANTKTDFCQ